MKIYNKDKTQQLSKENLDFNKGYLLSDKLFVRHHKAIAAKEAVYEYISKEEIGGGVSIYPKLIEPAVEAKEAWDEYEDIQVFVPYTADEIRMRKVAGLRKRREQECFSVINRGQIWYDTLTAEEHEELKVWYIAWLNVTETLIVPNKPSWLNKTKVSDQVNVVEEVRNTVGYY